MTAPAIQFFKRRRYVGGVSERENQVPRVAELRRWHCMCIYLTKSHLSVPKVIYSAHAGWIYHDFFVFSFCADFHLPQNKIDLESEKKNRCIVISGVSLPLNDIRAPCRVLKDWLFF